MSARKGLNLSIDKLESYDVDLKKYVGGLTNDGANVIQKLGQNQAFSGNCVIRMALTQLWLMCCTSGHMLADGDEDENEEDDFDEEEEIEESDDGNDDLIVECV